MTALRDSCGRPVTSLRVSVTDRCNLRCFYCHNEGQRPPSDPAPACAAGADGPPSGSAGNGRASEARPPCDSAARGRYRERSSLSRPPCMATPASGAEMSPEEVERIVRVAAGLGIRKVKLTGGEPLVRRDLAEIVRRCASHTDEVALTTNGLGLDARASPLAAAGLRRVNISIHTADPETYSAITGRDRLARVRRAVRAALGAGLSPVKLNAVVLRGLNEAHIEGLIRLAAGAGAILQLIELQGRGDEAWFREFHAALEPVERDLERRAVLTLQRPLHNRRVYAVPVDGKLASVEIVRGMRPEFCAGCTRLRITAGGRIQGCLFREDRTVDLLGPLRAGASDEVLAGLIRGAVEMREPYWNLPAHALRET